MTNADTRDAYSCGRGLEGIPLTSEQGLMCCLAPSATVPWFGSLVQGPGYDRNKSLDKKSLSFLIGHVRRLTRRMNKKGRKKKEKRKGKKKKKKTTQAPNREGMFPSGPCC